MTTSQNHISCTCSIERLISTHVYYFNFTSVIELKISIENFGSHANDRIEIINEHSIGFDTHKRTLEGRNRWEAYSCFL